MTAPISQLNAKPPRTTSPAGLLSQWWTLGTITADRRTTGRHAKVAWVIIDRYRQDFGNGRASVRYIARACDLSASIVSKACHELVEWGFFTQNIGSGTRPTEFTPKWATVPPVSHAKAVDISVLQGSDTCVPPVSHASDSSVLPVSDESYLLPPADNAGGQLVGNKFEAAPVAPLADGLEAAAAGPASGGFAEFWIIWPRKHGKAAARAAFSKLDSGQQADAIAAALLWADHYARHGVDKRYIPEPANWLKGERWDEDLPIIHDDAKGAAIAKAKANAVPKAANDNMSAPPFMVGEINPWSPYGTFRTEFTSADVFANDNGETVLRLEMQLETEEVMMDSWHEFVIESDDSEVRAEGQAMLRQVVEALGLPSTPDDTDDLLFLPLRITTSEGLCIAYARA